METVHDILIYFAGSVAIAILLWQAHLWWIERQERKTVERMEARYWQEITDKAIEEAESILKEARR